MKRIFIILSVLILFLVQDTWALSSFEVNEVADGKVALFLKTTNTGYASSIKIKFKIEGNVTPLSFHWSDTIESRYTRKIIFDDKDNTLLLIVATGTDDNLMSEEGIISLGTLEILGNTTKNDRYYKVKIDNHDSIELVTNDYQKLVLDDIEEQEDVTYVLKGTQEENSNNKEEHENVDEGESTISKNDDSVKADDENGDNVEILTPSAKEEEKAVVKESHSYLIPISVSLGVILIGTSLYVSLKKRKKMS